MRQALSLITGLILLAGSFAATAQPADRPPIVSPGDAVVTGFSGIAPPVGPALPANAAGADRAFINAEGAAARVIPLGALAPRWDAGLRPSPRTFDVAAKDVGQVFGVAIDDQSPPNVYLSATSAFGLNIVGRGRDGQIERRKTGGPGTVWMRGQFGLDLQGDPGSIYRVDGRTGAVTLFAKVQLDGVPNPGAALGNLAYDSANRQLFVSDLYTGMIHRIAIADGAERGAPYDHGVAGRTAAGQQPAPFNPARRPNIASTAFNAEDVATWGFAPPERRVWGVAVSAGRLFYSARNGSDAEGAQIFSVGILPDGGFAGDPRWELDVPARPGPYAVSDIAFGRDGAIIVAQRAPAMASYDHSAFTRPGEPRVLRFVRKAADEPPSPGVWRAEPIEIAVGFAGAFRNTNGGVALGYGTTPDGRLDANACEQSLWTTGQKLRDNPALRDRLEPGGPLRVTGLQGVPVDGALRAGEPPFASAFVDYDDRFTEERDSGHMGGVRILTQPCADAPRVAGGAPPVASPPTYVDGPQSPPPPPVCVGPNCVPCRFGNNPDGSCREPIDLAIKKEAGYPRFDEKTGAFTVQFLMVVTNTGNPFAPGNSIAVNDPVPAGMTFVSATGPGWTCTAAINCTFAFGSGVFATGATLPPIVITLTAKEPGTYENCARVGVPASSGFVETTLANNRGCASVDMKYPPNVISVVKTPQGGPIPQCGVGSSCVFTITVTNNSAWPFNGPLTVNENSGIAMTVANTDLPCSPMPTATPFTCVGNFSIPANSSQVFTIAGVIPPGSIPLDEQTAKNCIGFGPAPPNPGFPSTVTATGEGCTQFLACGFQCHMNQNNIDQIKIEKLAVQPTCTPGGLCSFTYTVSNVSTTNATSTFPITFISSMPAGAASFVPPPVPSPWSCIPFGAGQIKCLYPPGSIPAGGSLTVTVNFQIAAGYTQPSLTNCADFFIGQTAQRVARQRVAATMDAGALRAYLETRGVRTVEALSIPPKPGPDDKSCVTVAINQPKDKPVVVAPPPPPPPPPACAPPMIPGAVVGQCVCPQGTRQRGRECVPTLVCRSPRVANAAGTACVCPEGMTNRGGTCVRPPVCTPPAKLNRRGVCECPPDMVARRNTCVPRERPRPEIDMRDIIRVIPGGGGRDRPDRDPRGDRPDRDPRGGQDGPRGVR